MKLLRLANSILESIAPVDADAELDAVAQSIAELEVIADLNDLEVSEDDEKDEKKKKSKKGCDCDCDKEDCDCEDCEDCNDDDDDDDDEKSESVTESMARKVAQLSMLNDALSTLPDAHKRTLLRSLKGATGDNKAKADLIKTMKAMIKGEE